MKLYINSLFIALVTLVWSSIYWLGDGSLWVVLQQYKPFTYRVLVPVLYNTLSRLTGIPTDVALVLVVTFSGVAFYLALRKLYFLYNAESTQGEIYILAWVLVGLLVFGYERKPYDLMTAFLITLGLYYILTVQNWKYLIVFILACFNRETTFLLILVYVVMLLCYRRYGMKFYWWMTACQVYIYGLITYCLRVMYQYSPGLSVTVEPWSNLVKYYTHPVQTLAFLGVLGVMLWGVFKDWNSKSFSLRLVFVATAPLLLVMYLVCGQALEVRVFWEVFPVVGLLIIKGDYND